MKAGVITFPASNCDDDAVYALTHTGDFSVEKIWHKDSPDLREYDLVVLPGGFSYGDYLRCGAIAAVSPVMISVKSYAKQGGLLMGICNGFQILCEAGLLPGALVRNAGLRFICQDVTLRVEANNNPWLTGASVGDTLILPIAHGDGRYVLLDTEVTELKKNDQILLTYINNPNGSVSDIAGVCNASKNVFGLMPHPERACDLRSHHGKKVFDSLVDTMRKARKH